jgi:hypothetical protein
MTRTQIGTVARRDPEPFSVITAQAVVAHRSDTQPTPEPPAQPWRIA